MIELQPVTDTDLMLITKDNKDGRKLAHIIPVPTSREITLLSRGKEKDFYTEFLPNNLVCFYKSGIFLTFCPTTKMMVYADKTDLEILEEKQVISVGGNTFYLKDKLWKIDEQIE
jgi:hypothetical protein